MGEQLRPDEKYKGHQTWQEAYENPEELYTAKEIFDLIQFNEFDKLNPEPIRRGLLEKGQKEEDIDLSLRLMACIAAVHRASTEEKSIKLEFLIKEYGPNPDIFAMYCPKQEGESESYAVCVPDLQRKTLEDLKNKKIRLVGEEGKFLKDLPSIAMEEFLLGVAVHEARHRFQKQEGIEMFSKEDILSSDKKLNKIVSFVSELFKITKELLEKENKSEEIIKDRTNASEFDCNVVEFLTHNKIHNGITLKEFFNLVKTQPENKK